MKKIIHFLLSPLLFLVTMLIFSCGGSSSDSDGDTNTGGNNGSTNIAVTGISLKSSTSILVGNTEQLYATISPSNATNQNVTWSTSDAGKATVSSGLVKGEAAGTAVITVRTEDGGYSAACTVNVSAVEIHVTGISLNKSSISLDPGASEQLNAIIEPADATNQNVIWTTANSARTIVSVNGLVTAIGLVSGSSGAVTVTSEDGGYSATCNVSVNWAPVYSADGVSFTMAYVPGGITFPHDSNDASTATVANGYWIGETEVTYELWNTVYTWATDAARGANKYYFANPGRQGGDTNTGNTAVGTNKHPVTTINWRDAIVWCNAATEWYNAKNSTSYTCVYTYSFSIIRDSRDTNQIACDGAAMGSLATGFRLLMRNEWELAARWRNNDTNTFAGYSSPWFTTGNSASGATANYLDAAANQEVAWYAVNSEDLTHIIKTRTGNTLGLYDMSGNVAEWGFNLFGSSRMFFGGAWNWAASTLMIGTYGSYSTTDKAGNLGFRISRSD
ncbi:MAG: Ig-like domain-containing protein [Spirochaetota bacterium]